MMVKMSINHQLSQLKCNHRCRDLHHVIPAIGTSAAQVPSRSKWCQTLYLVNVYSTL